MMLVAVILWHEMNERRFDFVLVCWVGLKLGTEYNMLVVAVNAHGENDMKMKTISAMTSGTYHIIKSFVLCRRDEVSRVQGCRILDMQQTHLLQINRFAVKSLRLNC